MATAARFRGVTFWEIAFRVHSVCAIAILDETSHAARVSLERNPFPSV